MNARSARACRLLGMLVLALGLGVGRPEPALARTGAPGPATDAVPLRPAYTRMVEGVSTQVVVVRFLPATGARVRGGEMVSLTGVDLDAIDSLVRGIPGAVLQPRFPQSQSVLDELRRRGEERVRRPLPDLNLYAQVTLPALASEEAAEERLATVLDALHEIEGVAEAWAEPIAQPAGRVGAAAVDGEPAATDHSAERTEERGTTPDFSPQQGYLYEAPIGIEAPSAWQHPGGTGSGIDFIDIEWGWLFTHEDLPDPFYTAGDYGGDDHGTAVVGEVSGIHNGYGINGIAPDVRTGAISLNTFSIPGAILDAGTVLDPGDVFLMEVQCSGPENWMPCEWWQDVFDAIEVVTANGIVCVEAGGNGTVNLDDPLYGDAFDRRNRDSGAIVVGAGTPTGLNAEWFTNYGTRTDLQGWGSSIVTTCCGDLQGGDPEVRYTAGFNGTSGASPIVTGAIASLQGQALALFGEPLTPDLTEEILSATGSPWTGDRQIGERPNLLAARDRLLLGFGDVTVTVRDGDTQEPLADRVVQIVETGRIDKTGPDGTTQLQLTATDLTFRAEGDFFYPSVEVPFTVLAGQTQELTIDIFRAPFGSIEGQVKNDSGVGVGGAEVHILGAPLDPVSTDPGGHFVLGGVPENVGYELIASGVPGLGVGYAQLDVSGGSATPWNPVLPDAETFEAGGGGYTPTGEFERGTPSFPLQNPPPTFSGSNVWATNIDGPYSDVTISTLTSPTIDVSDAEKILLTFHHWYWIDPDDGGQVQVWDASQNRWVVVEPVGGYPDESIIVLLWTGGYNGYTVDGYVPAVFDLSSWIAGGELRFRFYFRSTASGHKLGWYIDDVALDLGLADPASIEDLTFESQSGRGPLRLLGAAPNPFSGTSTIRFELTAPSPVSVDLYAPDGAWIRRLDLGPGAVGRHQLEWDGRTAAGLEAGAGTYFYVVRAPGAEVSGRLVRVR